MLLTLYALKPELRSDPIKEIDRNLLVVQPRLAVPCHCVPYYVGGYWYPSVNRTPSELLAYVFETGSQQQS